ncbi:metacaspase-1 [Kwoniella pini CBS 10737]|uniref:Metacaspase-1 n=1 Tax=Kwoniella pini CBS 10737 TaxID=1296096 RepID=A0AAJ8MNB2_9TREE
MSGDEYEEYYQDAASDHSSSDHERYVEAEESRDDDSDHSHHSRKSSHSSKSHHSDEDQNDNQYRGERQHHEEYRRQDEYGDYGRGPQPVEEPFYSGNEYNESRHSDGSGGIPAGVMSAFGAMGLGGQNKHQDQSNQRYVAYANDNQSYAGGEYRSSGDQYNNILPPGPPPEHYYPTGAGYVPQQQYQAPQPPYGQQYRGDDDGRPRQQHYGPTFTDPQTGEMAQAYFEYSKCNGTRKALLIGINYFGTTGELAGCINDVHNVQKFICERFGYRPADIVMLTDDVNDPRTLPTRDNIIRGMQWLVEGAQKDDALFFHYSGHGTQTEDLNGDEGDDDDEAICPLDYGTAGLIVDDDIMSCSNGSAIRLLNRRENQGAQSSG